MSTAQEFTPELVIERLRHVLAELLEMTPSDLDPDVPLSAFGIDSMTGFVLAGDMEKWCGAELGKYSPIGSLTLSEAADEVVASLRQQPKE